VVPFVGGWLVDTYFVIYKHIFLANALPFTEKVRGPLVSQQPIPFPYERPAKGEPQND